MSSCSHLSLLWLFSILHLFVCDIETGVIKFEDATIEFVNTTYINEDTFDLSINYNKDKENSLRFNIDVIKDFPEVVYLKLSAVGRAFGQYKVPTGVNIDVSVCDDKMSKYFFGPILETIGVTECPPKKGHFGHDDFYPEIRGFATYALPGFHLRVDAELYSPPDISLIQVKVFMQIGTS